MLFQQIEPLSPSKSAKTGADSLNSEPFPLSEIILQGGHSEMLVSPYPTSPMGKEVFIASSNRIFLKRKRKKEKEEEKEEEGKEKGKGKEKDKKKEEEGEENYSVSLFH